jgi:DNA segregation ATPase FtsK/SpoIIIE, S-DNA-T family
MTNEDLIKQEYILIQRSRRINEDYKQQKSEISAQRTNELNTAELAWKKETAAIEGIWNHVQTQADNAATSVREAVKSAQEVFGKWNWQDRGAGGTPLPLTMPNNSSLAEQMVAYQAASEVTSKEIFTLLDNHKATSQGFLAGGIVSGFILAIMSLILLAALFPAVLSDPSRTLLFWLIGIFILLSTPGIIYAILKYLYNQRMLSKFKSRYAVLMGYLPFVEKLYQIQMNEGQTQYRVSTQQLNQAYQRHVAEIQYRYGETSKQFEYSLQKTLEDLRRDAWNFMQRLGYAGAAWVEPAWQGWRPSSVNSSAVRIGTLSVRSDLEIMTIPALVGSAGKENILFKVAGPAKTTVIDAIQALMLRLLATQPPGKVRFTLIDPIGLGQNVATFMQLADHDEKLVNSRAWTESRFIEQQLAALSEHMENVIQKYLRGQYQTIDGYNEKAGEVAEPYRILIVMGFPVNFTEETARRLVKIATNGPRCGVTTVVMMDTEQPRPHGFNLDDLERVATIIDCTGQDFVLRYTAQDNYVESRQLKTNIEECQLQLDAPPELNLFNSLLKEVGQSAKAASEVKVPFKRIAPSVQEWWQGNTREGLKVPLGRAGATKLRDLELGKSTAQHALVVGKTGSGKTTLLHVLIANLALTYAPDELELYLVDFKTVGFTPYALFKLPHARVVAIQSEREFGLSVLQGLNNEMERRKQIFHKANVPDIVQFRSESTIKMPRILLLVDEFQEFFTQDDKVAQDASLLLDRLVRQGRGFGIHILLASQTLAGAYSLARTTISQMGVRIALQCEEADSRLVLSDENPAARLLSRPGEAIYNSANGLVEGNNPFQSSWLADDELNTYLENIQRFAQRPDQRQHVPTWEQIIFDGSKDANVAKNPLLHGVLMAASWPMPQKTVQVWLGDPIAIKEPTVVQIRSQAGNNLLMVGQQEDAALGMMITGLVSLAAQHAPGTASFYVADFSPEDASYAGFLGKVAQLLQREVKVVNRRGLLNLITHLADEVQDRMEAEEGGRKSPIYLFFYGLQRARDLRPDEDFSYSSFGGDDAPPRSPAKQFTTILREGPELGIHTFAWCDTLANLNRTLERGTMREFEGRLVFQMSQEDSLNLVDSPAANKLGTHRALLFSEETGRAEKFIPYGLPTEQWLVQAAAYLRQKR